MINFAKPSLSLRAGSSSTPVLTSTPAARKPGDALTVNQRVGVGGGHHHPRDPCGYQRVRAGSGSSLVAAGFEGHIGGRTLGLRARLLESNDLGVVAAVILVEAFAHQSVAPNQHAADGRVGRGEADGPLRLL